MSEEEARGRIEEAVRGAAGLSVSERVEVERVAVEKEKDLSMASKVAKEKAEALRVQAVIADAAAKETLRVEGRARAEEEEKREKLERGKEMARAYLAKRDKERAEKERKAGEVKGGEAGGTGGEVVEKKVVEEKKPTAEKEGAAGTEAKVTKTKVTKKKLPKEKEGDAAKTLSPLPSSEILRKMTVPSLKSMLKDRKMKVGGKKAELVERLLGQE